MTEKTRGLTVHDGGRKETEKHYQMQKIVRDSKNFCSWRSNVRIEK